MSYEDYIGDEEEFYSYVRRDYDQPYDGKVHETEKAILYGCGDKAFWVPKSVSATIGKNVIRLPYWFTLKLIPRTRR